VGIEVVIEDTEDINEEGFNPEVAMATTTSETVMTTTTGEEAEVVVSEEIITRKWSKKEKATAEVDIEEAVEAIEEEMAKATNQEEVVKAINEEEIVNIGEEVTIATITMKGTLKGSQNTLTRWMIQMHLFTKKKKARQQRPMELQLKRDSLIR